MILSIDPGTTQTAYCFCNYDTLKPVSFGKVDNETIMSDVLPQINDYAIECVAIEHMQGYNMSVGKEVFETCYFIGRMLERIAHTQRNVKILPIYRKDEKLAICGNLKANDTIIRHTLIDMFAQHDLKNGKGTKDNKDWFWDFKADVWSAYAIAYTAKMMMEGKM